MVTNFTHYTMAYCAPIIILPASFLAVDSMHSRHSFWYELKYLRCVMHNIM